MIGRDGIARELISARVRAGLPLITPRQGQCEHEHRPSATPLHTRNCLQSAYKTPEKQNANPEGLA
ncbi:hypothetical protein [Neopusillimonas aromaticivorans]|uniref:hypothetical protein n=1 Tax=Neopusillimonas aromaticivorans TaxID=2979868 RepID=UPI00259325BD|nr:hypothetical protein [Neopusillimonas aromaticivorans]WJJ93458.1 hypothetical protein N7E01_16085 [Neopusillimonas aromaticivorans]